MENYVVLLRGINVGKAHQLKMSDLKEALETLGFKSVKTVLRSGNVVMQGELQEVKGIAKKIEEKLATIVDFPIPVMVVEAQTFIRNLEKCSFDTLELKAHEEILMVYRKSPFSIDELTNFQSPNEQWEIIGNCLFIQIYGNQLTSPLLKKLTPYLNKEQATTRNWRTATKLRTLLDEWTK